MAFSGAWLTQNGPFTAVDMQRVHTADPRHGEKQAYDPNLTGYTTPEGTTQTGFGIPEDEWMGGHGVTIEFSPQQHDPGIGERAHPSDAYIGGSGLGSGQLTQQQERAIIHGQSYGGDEEYSTAPMQDYTTTYNSIRSESPGPLLSDNAPTGWRGTFGNSSRQNNPPVEGWPDGFRRGEDQQPFVDRKFQIGTRYHDRHIVMPNDADKPTNQLRGNKPSPYLSPFDTARRAITRAWNTPMQLQAAPDFSQDLTQDTPQSGGEFIMPDWEMV